MVQSHLATRVEGRDPIVQGVDSCHLEVHSNKRGAPCGALKVVKSAAAHPLVIIAILTITSCNPSTLYSNGFNYCPLLDAPMYIRKGAYKNLKKKI